MTPVTVLVADHNPLMRATLRTQLATSDRVCVVGDAPDEIAALRQVRSLRPDVVLIDVRVRGSVEQTAAAAEISRLSRVVMTTLTHDQRTIREALTAGVCGYLVHGEFDAADLVAGVVAVAHGSGIFSAAALRAARTPAVTRPLPVVSGL